MPTWPSTLPQLPLSDSYSESPQSQVLRSSMDAGPPKTRRRFTAATRAIPMSFTLTNAQVEIFETWFDADIQGGSLPFDMIQPRTGIAVTMLISGEPPYQLTPIGTGSEYWRLSMQLEVQP